MNDSNASQNGANFSVQSLSLRVQKKILGKMSSRNVAKRFVSDLTADILDNLYKLLKEYYSKKDAEKVIKNILKLTIKMGVLVKNDQLNKTELQKLNQFSQKFRQICLTCVSFRSVEFSYDEKFLSDSLEKCRQILKQLVDDHLSDKSDQRLQHVFKFLNDNQFLDENFKKRDNEFLDKICRDLSLAMENAFCRNFDQFYDKQILEPMLNFMENYMKFFGPVFIALVLILIALIILVAYLIIIPYEYVARSGIEFGIFMIFGHYVLINFLYNYAKACLIGPGNPPKDRTFQYYSICKHCQHPKPFRAHHCRICGTCVLKMDHHCPWLNQCVGHFNHRYFYLTLVYVFIACIYLFIFTLRPFLEHYYTRNDEILPWCSSLPNLPYWSFFCGSDFENNDEKIYNFIIFEFCTSIAFGLGIGILLFWNSLLISRGETSIERLANKEQRVKMKQMGKDFKNPYDFGFKENWKIFFGAKNVEDLWLKILLPMLLDNQSTGDGLKWDSDTKSITI